MAKDFKSFVSTNSTTKAKKAKSLIILNKPKDDTNVFNKFKGKIFYFYNYKSTLSLLFFNQICMDFIYIVLGVIALLIIWLVTMYNKLVHLRLNRDNAFADIDVQLKQRYDLIPQLLSTVKWAKNFEKAVLLGVTEARTKAMWAKSIDDKIKAEIWMTSALAWFFAVAEAYPDIKSNQNFMQFQTEISDIENKLAASRRFFNSATKEYNAWIKTFPSNIVAWTFWFTTEIFFEIDNRETLKKAPDIKF